jgi:hypothetical protein
MIQGRSGVPPLRSDTGVDRDEAAVPPVVVWARLGRAAGLRNTA